ncbi:c-type cytochrome [Indiicoccus explosivorum]|uniref:c-type cytochrome n=1 Tax=Indiicoccus explosivorum TaxID=1917864 RepID=UPI001F4D3E4A|nr:cytochrome c [Indiicoccus explosivorum]
MKKQLMAAFFGTALLLGACGEEEADFTDADALDEEEAEIGDEEVIDDEVVEDEAIDGDEAAGEEGEDVPVADAPEDEPAEDDAEGSEAEGEVAAIDAEQIIQQNCTSCHGQDLEGSGNFPALNDVGSRLTEDEILTVIHEGPGAMPPEIITGEEAEAVAQYLSTLK